MSYDDPASRLELVKTALAQRQSNRAITTIISKHLHIINECLDLGFTRKDIYDFIFNDEDKEQVKFSYFNTNILYRAKLKIKNKKKSPTTQNIERSVNHEPATETIKPNTIIKNNPLADLSAPKTQKELHNSASDRKSLNDRVARLLAEKEGNDQ